MTAEDVPFTGHVERLLADADVEANARRWGRVRALAVAALALEPDNVVADRLLRRAEAATAQPGERRQLTVMFCDVVGSTALSSQADPEVVRDVLRAYQGVCGDVVSQYDGHIAHYLGDGVVVYFGYPTPHEDDPRRAVLAGLELIDALGPVAEGASRRWGIDLAVRVAVHTGLVVRAEMGGPERRQADAVVGEAPNVAARLQEHARPGTLLISGSTLDLVRGFFEVRHVGALELRGLNRPVDAYEVTGAAEATNRLESLRELSPFVGRLDELDTLDGLWRQTCDGSPEVALIRGDPGMGKSRLAGVFRERVTAIGGTALASSCSSFHTSTHLYPVRRLVEVACGIDSRDDPRDTIPLLRSALADLGREDLVGVFADLLGIPANPDWPMAEVAGPQLRELTFSALTEWVEAASRLAPLLLVIDDLQWADPSTLELMGRILGRRIPGLMLVMTARDGFRPQWSAPTVVIELGPLAPDDLRILAAAIAGGRSLDAASLDELIRRSDGVPLFMEELVRGLASERLAPAVSPMPAGPPIPSALLDPLLSRLAAEGLDLSLAQMIATIGQEADHELLAAVTGISEEELHTRLGALIAARLLDVTGGDHPVYRFHHHLLGELAYETQLLPIRRRRHSAVADALAAIEVRGVPGDAGAIGYHFEHAGRIADAVDAHVRSARAALSHGALTEATATLDHAFSLLELTVDDKERAGLELAVRQARGMAAVSVYGYAHPDAAADFERCVELCTNLGSAAADHLPNLTAVWLYYATHGDLDRADEIIAVDRRRLDLPPDALPEEACTGATRFLRGDFRGAVHDLEAFQRSPYAQKLDQTPEDWPVPDDPVVTTLSFLGAARWICGDPTGAFEALERAQQRALSLPFPHGPFALAYARLLTAFVLRLAGDEDEADRVTEFMGAAAERHGFQLFMLAAAAQRAIGSAHRQPETHRKLEEAFGVWQLAGLDVWNPWGLVEQASASLAAGDVRDAVAQAELAHAEATRTGAGFVSSEASRIRGLARLALGDDGGVGDLEAAAQLARDQGALVFELRALIARCTVDDDDYARSARKALAEVVATMTGADGLPELAAARQVLTEVGS